MIAAMAKQRTKLAEALLLRADMQTRLARLRERIAANMVVQQGDKPKEDPTKLLSEAAGLLRDLERLIVSINRTNTKAKIEDGRTMTEAIAARDMLKAHYSLILSSAEAAKRDPDRYGVREIKWVSLVDVARLQKQADDLAKKIREINGEIQKADWKIDLEE
jgi:hypothetical protein